jgi:hypothetical protein
LSYSVLFRYTDGPGDENCIPLQQHVLLYRRTSPSPLYGAEDGEYLVTTYRWVKRISSNDPASSQNATVSVVKNGECLHASIATDVDLGFR